MLKQVEFGNAKWIGTGIRSFPVCIATEINVSENEKAKITIGCFGTFKLYINGKKVCGILCESVDGYIIIGVGVNVTTVHFPVEISENAAPQAFSVKQREQR